jgi:hypothetical protein
MKAVASVLIVSTFVSAAWGCGTKPTEPTPVVETSGTLLFTGDLAQGGTAFNPVTVSGTTNVTVKVTLASVTSAATGEPLAAVLAVGFGSSAAGATSCTPTTTQNVGPALTAQITLAASAGTYCVNVADLGGLTEPAKFAIRIFETTAATPAGTSVADTFGSALAVGGVSTHTVTAAKAGTITVQLQNAGGDPAMTVGLGLGLWDGTTCQLTTSLKTAAGGAAQITSAVDAGNYCVLVKDIGKLTDAIGFIVNITHP